VVVFILLPDKTLSFPLSLRPLVTRCAAEIF